MNWPLVPGLLQVTPMNSHAAPISAAPKGHVYRPEFASGLTPRSHPHPSRLPPSLRQEPVQKREHSTPMFAINLPSVAIIQLNRYWQTPHERVPSVATRTLQGRHPSVPTGCRPVSRFNQATMQATDGGTGDALLRIGCAVGQPQCVEVVIVRVLQT